MTRNEQSQLDIPPASVSNGSVEEDQPALAPPALQPEIGWEASVAPLEVEEVTNLDLIDALACVLQAMKRGEVTFSYYGDESPCGVPEFVSFYPKGK
jgi:hypothetical protein